MHLRRERSNVEGLRQDRHPIFHLSASKFCLSIIAGYKKHFEISPELARSIRQLPACHAAWEADISQKQIDAIGRHNILHRSMTIVCFKHREAILCEDVGHHKTHI